MGILSFFDPALEALFSPIIALEPIYFVLVVSIVMSLITILAYKYCTDQKLMKVLKDEIKELQAEAKELREHPEKGMEVNKRMMETNMKYMMQSFRATFITLIPILLIFGYLNGALTYEPINPAQEFGIGLEFVEGIAGKITTSPPPGLRATGGTERTLTGSEVLFTFEGDPGRYLVEFTVDNKKYTHPVHIDSKRKLENPLQTINDNKVIKIMTSQKETIVANLFGWELGWLGTYILMSIILSIFWRKIFKVY